MNVLTRFPRQETSGMIHVASNLGVIHLQTNLDRSPQTIPGTPAAVRRGLARWATPFISAADAQDGSGALRPYFLAKPQPALLTTPTPLGYSTLSCCFVQGYPSFADQKETGS